jgi:hypothetical protein
MVLSLSSSLVPIARHLVARMSGRKAAKSETDVPHVAALIRANRSPAVRLHHRPS